jgi:Leucine-rich repeat (LRR) protein
MKDLTEREVQWLNAFAKTQEFFNSFLLFYKVKNQLSNNQYYWLNLYINKAEEDGNEILTSDQIAFLEKHHDNNERVQQIFEAYLKSGFLNKNEYLELLNVKKEITGIKKVKMNEIELEAKAETKIIKIPCPHCSFLCTPQTDFCLKCGEPLPKLEHLSQYKKSMEIVEKDYAEKNVIHSLEMHINRPIILKEEFNVSSLSYVKENDQITGLSLYNCGLEEFPIDIFKLKSLKHLALRRNNIKELPKSIGFLSNLEYLDMRINDLEHLPSAIGLLVNLKTLNLSSNKLKEIPDSIGDLLMLKLIDLSSNRLTTIPESIGNIEGLERLTIRANFWISIPKSIELLKKKGLKIV